MFLYGLQKCVRLNGMHIYRPSKELLSMDRALHDIAKKMKQPSREPENTPTVWITITSISF